MQQESRINYLIKRILKIIFPSTKIKSPSSDILIEKNIAVRMTDNIELKVNVYRPKNDGKHPVILSLHPYGKDKLPSKNIFGYNPLMQYRLMRQPGVVHMSTLTAWEAPDPDFWVSRGYVVINADARGYYESGGEISTLSDIEAQDYYNLIEWAAIQPWSNGKIGLNGVSYLAISQYKVAALNPPHLHAICPWEGLSDFYRDAARPGGIREDGFISMWSRNTSTNIREESYKRPLVDEWYKLFLIELEKINVPALICGSFSDHCLHTRGSFRAFDRISSKHKWLYTHRGGKWASYYSEEALSFQLKFFDYFLKGINNDLLSVPPVRLETHETRDQIAKISYHSSWPLSEVTWQKIFLDASNKTLSPSEVVGNATISFDNQKGQASFDYKIPYDLILSGPMKLQVHLEVEDCSDVNIFIGVFKLKDNINVPFEGSYGFGLDSVTKGWLKASLRHTEPTENDFLEPQHTFDRIELLQPKQIVSIEISLLPSSTLFRKDEVLRLNIQGHKLFKEGKIYSQLSDYEQSPPGRTIIHCGGKYNSYLLIPHLSYIRPIA